MARKALVSLLPLLLLLSCDTTAGITATTGKTEGQSTDDFGIYVEQMTTPEVFRGDTTADVKFLIAVKNRTQVPYSIRRITLQSMAGATYRLPPTTREYNRTVGPASTENFEYWATTEVSDQTMGARAPLTVRATLEAVNPDGVKRKETFMTQVNGRLGIGVTK